MKNSLETKLGMFFALAFISAMIIFEMIGGLDFFKRGFYVRAQFNNVQELKAGDPVKMAGVAIGRVDSISLTNNKVEVRMKLTAADSVRTDSIAAVRFVGLMGQNFVAIEFGSATAPRVTENTLLKTVEQADMNSIMTKLDNVASGVENLTKTFSGDSINNLLGPVTDFMKENNPRLSGIFSNAQTISAQIAKGEGTVGKLIMDDQLYKTALNTLTNLATVGDEVKLALSDVKQTVTGIRTTFDSINTGQGTLGKLVKDETLYTETTSAMKNAREILEKVNKGQGTIGKIVNDETLYRNTRMTLQKLEKMTEGLEDQGPISVLGIIASSLF